MADFYELALINHDPVVSLAAVQRAWLTEKTDSLGLVRTVRFAGAFLAIECRSH